MPWALVDGLLLHHVIWVHPKSNKRAPAPSCCHKIVELNISLQSISSEGVFRQQVSFHLKSFAWILWYSYSTAFQRDVWDFLLYLTALITVQIQIINTNIIISTLRSDLCSFQNQFLEVMMIVPCWLQVRGAASHTGQQVRLSPSASDPETQ